MTVNSRMAKIADRIPPKVAVNPYMGMSTAELLVILKDIVQNGGEPETPEQAEYLRLAKQALTNNGIAWQVSE
jgi:hypothetical protein